MKIEMSKELIQIQKQQQSIILSKMGVDEDIIKLMLEQKYEEIRSKGISIYEMKDSVIIEFDDEMITGMNDLVLKHFDTIVTALKGVAAAIKLFRADWFAFLNPYIEDYINKVVEKATNKLHKENEEENVNTIRFDW